MTTGSHEKENMYEDNSAPAFPCNSPDGLETYKGMSLRDYFAGQALIGYISDPSVRIRDNADSGYIAEICYMLADAMLAKRDRGNEEC